jgi:hypothetical protein
MLIADGSPLFATLDGLARHARCVFFAGLPGTGKSLLIRELAHLAHGQGRRIHLLQWDVTRPPFEASEAGQRYPLKDGVTHGVIRLAVGRWARAAIARWHVAHAGAADLLIGETPFIGHRLIELARRVPDDAEPLLASAATRFVIPVPSRDLRAHLEAERDRRARAPLHPREREDAPPAVLRALWDALFDAAIALRLLHAESGERAPYDPELYRRVYERLLRWRHVEALGLHTVLATDTISAYDVRVPTVDLMPSPQEVTRFVREVEAQHADPIALERAIAAWYVDTPFDAPVDSRHSSSNPS